MRRAKAYIAAGDIMQVVLSQRLSMPFDAAPLSLYRALRSLNPSPYMFFATSATSTSSARRRRSSSARKAYGDAAADRRTRPRGATRDADEAYAAELAADEKERAEHVMLLDLGRNDVGRVAATGTCA